MKPPFAKVETIAVFRALHLGDILCSIPAMRVLRGAYPNAIISFIGLPGMAALIARFPKYIDEFISFPGYPGLPEQTFNLFIYREFLAEMRSRKFDLILQMQGSGKVVNTMLSSFGAKVLAGFCEYIEEQNAFFMHYPNFGHEITRHLALMRHLDIGSYNEEVSTLLNDVSLEFPIYTKDFQALEDIGTMLQMKRYICLHPGSRGSWRQWPPLFFASIADFCALQGYAVVITGTNNEAGLAANIASMMKSVPIISSGKTTLGSVAALVNNAHAVISNCTGVSHIAAALKVQSVVISMDGEPERWGSMNTTLHRTIDWTKNADYEDVLREVESLFS